MTVASWPARVAALALLAAQTGCINEDYVFYVTDITVDVDAPGDGPITVVFHHAWQGEGVTGHPLGPIEEVTFDALPATHTLSYPQHAGEGLVLYAWQDDDGDGVLCAPGVDDEASGVTEVEGFPAHQLDAFVTLDALCRGAEGLYP